MWKREGAAPAKTVSRFTWLFGNARVCVCEGVRACKSCPVWSCVGCLGRNVYTAASAAAHVEAGDREADNEKKREDMSRAWPWGWRCGPALLPRKVKAQIA